MNDRHPTTAQQVIERAVRDGVRYVDLQFTDIPGIVKNIALPAAELEHALEHGVWFDGSSIEGFARVAESDMLLVPDPTTYALLPWLDGEDTTARLICDVHTPSGQPAWGAPRWALARALDGARGMGLTFMAGPEMEFFLLRPHDDGALIPLRPNDTASYFDRPSDQMSLLRRQMVSALAAFGITVEALHHELATGQHEIDFRYAEAMRAADSAVTLRVVLKTVAERNGLYGTFVPKPLRGIPGSGMHVHQSLHFVANGRNAFSDPGDPHGLSRLARRFIAGQLHHARGMCAILAPLVNSYKRLGAGFEAPSFISWGRINRSALIRVPRADDPESTRIELRCPDPSCNPYLALAVMLAAGLDGIRRELPVPDATDEDLYALSRTATRVYRRLPLSLDEALDELERDEVIRETLGPQIMDTFVQAKRQECLEYASQVTRWEVNRYLRY